MVGERMILDLLDASMQACQMHGALLRAVIHMQKCNVILKRCLNKPKIHVIRCELFAACQQELDKTMIRWLLALQASQSGTVVKS